MSFSRLPRCRHARPYGFEIDFVRNSISGSTAGLFITIIDRRLADTDLEASRSHRQIEAMGLVLWCSEKN